MPLARASEALARLDERLAPSPVGTGLIERLHFADACASLWLDGELVDMEDLVLHEAARDIRSPSHQLTIARDVLQTRRRINAGARLGAEWERFAQSAAGVAYCPIWWWRHHRGEGRRRRVRYGSRSAGPGRGGRKHRLDDGLDLPGIDLDAIDAVLARSEDVLIKAKEPRRSVQREMDPLIRDPDWDEDERLDEWRAVLRKVGDLPPVLPCSRSMLGTSLRCCNGHRGSAVCWPPPAAARRVDKPCAFAGVQCRLENYPRRTAPSSQF